MKTLLLLSVLFSFQSLVSQSTLSIGLYAGPKNNFSYDSYDLSTNSKIDINYGLYGMFAHGNFPLSYKLAISKDHFSNTVNFSGHPGLTSNSKINKSQILYSTFNISADLFFNFYDNKKIKLYTLLGVSYLPEIYTGTNYNTFSGSNKLTTPNFQSYYIYQTNYSFSENHAFLLNLGISLEYKLSKHISFNISPKYSNGIKTVLLNHVAIKFLDENGNEIIHHREFVSHGDGFYLNFGLQLNRYLYSKKHFEKQRDHFMNQL